MARAATQTLRPRLHLVHTLAFFELLDDVKLLGRASETTCWLLHCLLWWGSALSFLLYWPLHSWRSCFPSIK